jgi:hypothetical protein
MISVRFLHILGKDFKKVHTSLQSLLLSSRCLFREASIKGVAVRKTRVLYLLTEGMEGEVCMMTIAMISLPSVWITSNHKVDLLLCGNWGALFSFRVEI